MRRIVFLVWSAIFLASCSSSHYDGLPNGHRDFDADSISNAVPKVEPKSRYGNPSSYTVLGHTYHVMKNIDCYQEKGIASWYGTKFNERRTSSGEPYNMYSMTAANKVLPLPTYVRVINLQTGRTIIVKVNDRGPFHENRIIDLSFAAAKKIGMMSKGTALVEVQAIDPKHPDTFCGHGVTQTHAQKTQIYLQIGAFSSDANAQQFAKQVGQHTHRPVSVITVTAKAKTLYKVQIGPIKNVNETDEVTNRLRSAGLGSAFAVVR
ncbi:MAG: septal ring lytic transglycosylase RlpA family protein [Gammaproteobacteria bacterium]|nr:septal ring lytic transglycosylase RlpA family protein [Gammaproteobacteria bacterium]